MADKIVFAERRREGPFQNHVRNLILPQQRRIFLPGQRRTEDATIYALRDETFQDQPLLCRIFVTVAQSDHIPLLPGNGFDIHTHACEESIGELRHQHRQNAPPLSLQAAGGGIFDIPKLRRGLQDFFPQFRPQGALTLTEHIGNRGNGSAGQLGHVFDCHRWRKPLIALPHDLPSFQPM